MKPSLLEDPKACAAAKRVEEAKLYFIVTLNNYKILKSPRYTAVLIDQIPTAFRLLENFQQKL